MRQPDRIIRFDTVRARTGLSRSTIYRKIKEGTFPAQLKIIKKAKYKGYLSLEFEGMEDPIKAVTLGLEYLKLQLEAIGAYEA